MSTHAIENLPILCIPHEHFSFENLTDDSVYGESGRVTGTTTPVSVSGRYQIYQEALSEISDEYDIFLKIQQPGSVNTYQSTVDNTTFLYRNLLGDSDLSKDHWMGWANLHTVMDITTVNQAEGAGATQYLYPRMAEDKDGRLYVVYKWDKRVGLNIRDTDGTWTETSGSTTAVVTSDENNAPSNSSRVESDICYDRKNDRLYLFYPTWNSGDTKMSIGVKVSGDNGQTWDVLSRALVDLTSAYALDDDTIFRIRAIHNPVTDTFTLCFIYDAGGTIDLRTVILGANLEINQWPDATIQNISGFDTVNCYDITIDPVTGIEYLFTYIDTSNTLTAYRKTPGKVIWTQVTTSTAFSQTSDLSTVGIAAFWHHDGKPACFLKQGAASTHILLYVNENSLTDSIFLSQNSARNILGKVSNLEHISVIRHQDSIYVIGNPNSVATTHDDSIIMYTMGGWTNIPPVQTDQVLVCPWDTPDDQVADVTTLATWTDATATSGTVTAYYDTTLKEHQIRYLAIGNTASEAYSFAQFSSSGVTPDYLDVQVQIRMSTGNSSHSGSTKDGLGYIDLEFREATTKLSSYLKISTSGFRWRDVISGTDIGDDVSVDTTAGDVWIRAILDKATYQLTAFYSLDGRIWTKFVNDVVLNDTAALSADYIQVKIGVDGYGSGTTDMRLLTMKVDTSSSVYNAVIYDQYTDEPTSVIGYMPGMPLAYHSNYVLNGMGAKSTSGTCITGDYWSLKSDSTGGPRNVLIDGHDSPRINWRQSVDDGDATLIWSMPESISMNSGFVYFDGVGAESVILKKGSTAGGDLSTLASFSCFAYLGGVTWSRYSHTIVPTSTNSVAEWFKKDQLKGCYLVLGSYYRLITGNTEGYWSADGGRRMMEISITGDTTGLPSTDSGLYYQPAKFVMFYNITNPHYASRNDDYQLIITTGGGPGYLQVNTIRVGTYHPIACAIAPGRTRGVSSQGYRTSNKYGVSQGYKTGPSIRSMTLQVTDYDPASRYQSPSTNYVSMDGTNIDADVSSGAELLQYVSDKYGVHEPIVFVPNMIAIAANDTTTLTNQDGILYGYCTDSLNLSYDMPPGYDAIRTSSEFTITEVT